MAFSFTSAGPGSTNTPSTAPATGGLFGGGGGPSIFGGVGASKPSGAGIFGNKAAETPASSAAPATGGLFGNTTTTAPAPTNMFGGGSSSSAAPSALFSATKPAGAGIFGQKPPGEASSTPASAPGTSALFGNNTSTATTATPAKTLFAMPSTTPAGAPPSDSSKPATGLFGNKVSQPASSGTGLFGNAAAPAAITSQPASQPTTTAPSGLFGAGQTTTTPAAGLFGNVNKPAAATTSTSTPPLFGAKQAAPSSTTPATTTAGGLFGAGAATSATPASTTTTASTAPAAGGLFGAAASATTPAVSATPAAGGLFGVAASSTAPAPAVSTTPAAGGLFGAAASSTAPAPAASTTPAAGGLFGAKPASDAAKPASALFGAAAGSSTTAQTQASSAAPATSTAATPAATTGLFGAAKPAADASKDSAKTPTATTNFGASTTGPTSQMARLKNKTMEDIVTRWASDLSKYQKEFKEQAQVVSKWDRQLVENGEKIQKLYLDTFEAERASHEIERQLLSVEGQQDELEAWLDRYESEVSDMFAKQIGPGEQLTGPDQERERTYKLAEKLSQHLEEKSKDLSKMVQEINDISGALIKGAKPEDPLSQIVRVLNGHLTQLQWIDANASDLQAKVVAAQKSNSNLGTHYGGSDNDAAESFYRSYMGRR